MEYNLVDKPAMKFIGIGVDTSVKNASVDCPKVWAEFMKRYKEIPNYVGGMKNYGVCVNPNNAECTFRYVACAEVSEFPPELPEGMEKVEIPAETYLIVEHKGLLSGLGETYGALMELIPSVGKKEKGEFWVEFYDIRWKGDKEDSLFEIWTPVE